LGKTLHLASQDFAAANLIIMTLRRFVPRDLAPFPNIRAYLKRIGARPAYRRAMAKGDPNLPPMLD